MSAGRDSDVLPPSRILSFGRLTVRFNWFIALCVVLSCGMFINLALWQLERAAEKRQAASLWEAMQSAEPEEFTQFAVAQQQNDAMASFNGQPLRLTGHYEPSPVAFLVMYQFWQGRPGFELISPFRLESSDEYVLVSRGWIPAGEGGSLPDIPEVSGRHELIARLHVPDLASAAVNVTDDSWPLRMQRLNTQQASALFGEPFFPHVLRLEPEQPGVLVRHWSAPDFSARMHYGYAFQWFLFTLLVLILTVMLSTNLLRLLRDR